MSIHWVARALLAGAFVCTSCSTKNPVVPGTPGDCEHADADGMVIDQGVVTVAYQWQAQVVGAFALADTQSVRGLRAVFLSPDSSRIGTEEFCSHELRWEVADTSIAQVVAEPGDPWGFSLRGKAQGTTQVRFRIWHVDHPDFTSQPFEIQVSGTPPHVPIAARGAVLFKGGSRVSSWGWGIAGGYGKLFVPQSGVTWPIGIQWVDSAGAPVEPGPGYSLAWSVGASSIARVVGVPGEPWNVRVEGLSIGTTSVAFSLLWNGVPEFTTGPIDVLVADTAAAPSQPVNFVLRKSGVRHVFVENGSVVASCGATISTGFLPARADTVEDLFNFRLTTPTTNCSGSTPGSGSQYSLVYEFDDPGIAGVVAHPEHLGEYFDFHLRGLSLGETQLRIILLSGSSVVFRSPPMRVSVTTTGSAPNLAMGDPDMPLAAVGK